MDEMDYCASSDQFKLILKYLAEERYRNTKIT